MGGEGGGESPLLEVYRARGAAELAGEQVQRTGGWTVLQAHRRGGFSDRLVSEKASKRQHLSWTLVKTAPGWSGGEECSK